MALALNNLKRVDMALNKETKLISARRPDLMIINKKKKRKICKVVDFAVPADHRIKLKESEKRD